MDRQTDFFNKMILHDGTPIVPKGLADFLISGGFFKKPAAISHHGNYIGGLYDHSKAVMNAS